MKKAVQLNFGEHDSLGNRNGEFLKKLPNLGDAPHSYFLLSLTPKFAEYPK